MRVMNAGIVGEGNGSSSWIGCEIRMEKHRVGGEEIGRLAVMASIAVAAFLQPCASIHPEKITLPCSAFL